MTMAGWGSDAQFLLYTADENTTSVGQLPAWGGRADFQSKAWGKRGGFPVPGTDVVIWGCLQRHDILPAILSTWLIVALPSATLGKG